MATLTDLARRLKLALVAVTDERRGGDPLALAARLPRGSLVILRHYGAPDRSVLAIELATICRKNRLKLMVAGDLNLAILTRAGLHLPDGMAKRASPRIRLWQRRGGTLTMAAHGRSGLRRAIALRAEAVLLSPVFPTNSHPGAKPLGLQAFRRLARGADLPVIALGGIDGKSVLQLKNAPIAGVAAVGAFCSQK
jgi:thiamine-phosphate pyrophosphorylase